MRQKIDAGSALAALGAALLLVSLFVRWFDPGGTAWQVFEVVDLVLAGIALAALMGTLARSDPAGEPPRWLLGVSAAALAVVAVQLIDPPPSARGSDIATGAWLALAATAVMAIGAGLSRSSVSIIVDVRQRDRRRRVPAVDRRADVAAGPAPAPAPAPELPGDVVSAPSFADDPGRTQPMSALPHEGEERA
jgi:peptidoglycan/LPS O-acetylase OafA/YrhL